MAREHMREGVPYAFGCDDSFAREPELVVRDEPPVRTPEGAVRKAAEIVEPTREVGVAPETDHRRDDRPHSGEAATPKRLLENGLREGPPREIEPHPAHMPLGELPEVADPWLRHAERSTGGLDRGHLFIGDLSVRERRQERGLQCALAKRAGRQRRRGLVRSRRPELPRIALQAQRRCSGAEQARLSRCERPIGDGDRLAHRRPAIACSGVGASASMRAGYRGKRTLMHAAWWMLGALAVLAIGYRYYSAFIAARVLCLDDARVTPAHRLEDGQNFHPTNRVVLFGHHFAAITGAGPLIGPVLAAQFGFLPGFLWILFGVVLGGAVHDFVILVASTRRNGRSLAEIAREELGPTLGLVTGIAILFIVVIALAGLGNVVVGALAESAWGVFTVGASIPIALAMGFFIQRLRGGSARGIREATIAGVVLLFLALIAGKHVGDSDFAHHLKLSRTFLTLAMAAYGFVASVLPVWMLLCPRDYLSSYLKIGTIGLLVFGVIIVNPSIQMPAVTAYIHGGGPIVKGPLFPFVFITIACGAISGFHALVSSGTTPKMIDRERDCRAIGYGAMLMEGLVGITALVAACAMPQEDYVAINTNPQVAVVASAATHDEGLARDASQLAALGSVLSDHDRRLLGLDAGEDVSAIVGRRVPLASALALSNKTLAALDYRVDANAPRATMLDDADFARMGVKVKELPALQREADEVVAARTGGGVSLAIGMARVFSGLPGMSTLLSYWYHFAIMFEALFILTTIDTGTRIGRFLMQEMLARLSPDLGSSTSRTGGVLATVLIVAGWTYFILTGSISTIWPMFGIANQLLACTALCVATTIILREGKKKSYALVTLAPLAFVGTTTITAGVESIGRIFVPMMGAAATRTTGIVNVLVTVTLLVCVALVIVGSAIRWWSLARAEKRAEALAS